ncbi:hypothetical protein Hanom_Chr10g00902771 [Helianthus anomalus]
MWLRGVGWSVMEPPSRAMKTCTPPAPTKITRGIIHAWNYTRVERITRCKIVDCMCMTYTLCINTCTLESHH